MGYFQTQCLSVIALILGVTLCNAVPVQALSLEKIGSINPIGVDGDISPSGLWYDPQQALLGIADTENNRVLLLDRQGNLFKALGRRGQLSWPLAGSTSNGSMLYLAERDSAVIKLVADYSSLTREEYTPFDLSRFAVNHPVQPVALFSSDDGSLYVCDRGNRQLLIFDKNRRLQRVVPKVGEPTDVWVTRQNIYLADPGYGGIRVYNLQGEWLRTLGDSTTYFPTPLRPRAIAVDRRERLWVLDESGSLHALDALGNPRFSKRLFDLFLPVDLALDHQNNLYVLERGGNRITVFRINEF